MLFKLKDGQRCPIHTIDLVENGVYRVTWGPVGSRIAIYDHLMSAEEIHGDDDVERERALVNPTSYRYRP